MENHLNDVISTDRHTVKPWFQGKLDFAPAVADFESAGFALMGGRLDYLNGRPVAALTYRHRLHVVNLFEWPAAGAGDTAPESIQRNGYVLAHWKRGGIQYWAISDIAGADLLGFAQLLTTQ
jgi:anti-sigma factor RsiW